MICGRLARAGPTTNDLRARPGRCRADDNCEHGLTGAGPRDATRGGVKDPALPGKRGRKSPSGSTNDLRPRRACRAARRDEERRESLPCINEPLRDQLVAEAVDREDVARALLVFLELAAQLDDEVVDGAAGRG